MEEFDRVQQILKMEGGGEGEYLPVSQRCRHDDLMTGEVKVNKSLNNKRILGFHELDVRHS